MRQDLRSDAKEDYEFAEPVKVQVSLKDTAGGCRRLSTECRLTNDRDRSDAVFHGYLFLLSRDRSGFSFTSSITAQCRNTESKFASMLVRLRRN